MLELSKATTLKVFLNLFFVSSQHQKLIYECADAFHSPQEMNFTYFCITFFKIKVFDGCFISLIILMSNQFTALHRNWSFLLRIPSVNKPNSAVSCGFGHIYGRTFNGKLHFCALPFLCNANITLKCAKLIRVMVTVTIDLQLFPLMCNHYLCSFENFIKYS